MQPAGRGGFTTSGCEVTHLSTRFALFLVVTLGQRETVMKSSALPKFRDSVLEKSRREFVLGARLEGP